MISETLKEIVESISKQGKMLFLEGASDEQIGKFEDNNSIKLPSQYREWLHFSDGGECFLPAGVQFYGVNHKPLIEVNSNNLSEKKYIIIGALSTGDPILCENNAETISIYNLESGRIEEDEIYKDFHAFLNDLYDILGIGD